jgi:hypothetical protein
MVNRKRTNNDPQDIHIKLELVIKLIYLVKNATPVLNQLTVV